MVDLAIRTQSSATEGDSPSFASLASTRAELRLLIEQGLPGDPSKGTRLIDEYSCVADTLQQIRFGGNNFRADHVATNPLLLDSETDTIEKERQSLLESLEQLSKNLNAFGSRFGIVDLGAETNQLIERVTHASDFGDVSRQQVTTEEALDAGRLLANLNTSIEAIATLYGKTQSMQSGNGLTLLQYYDGSGTREERSELRRLLNSATTELRKLLGAINVSE
ncbi:MAG: hypothetical protein J0M18_16480 [Ignavibacteria bacterium]|nr:hypothetical protein [Ignavibacteria bacterium]